MPTRKVIINGREQIDPRLTWSWRKLRNRVIVEEPTCRLRFPGICTAVSTTADHIVPVSARPELALLRANVRGSCKPCNEARRNVPNESLKLGGDESPALGIFR